MVCICDFYLTHAWAVHSTLLGAMVCHAVNIYQNFMYSRRYDDFNAIIFLRFQYSVYIHMMCIMLLYIYIYIEWNEAAKTKENWRTASARFEYFFFFFSAAENTLLFHCRYCVFLHINSTPYRGILFHIGYYI